MSTQNVFTVRQGLIQIEKVYWHTSEDTGFKDLPQKVSLYSDASRNNSVFLHLRVSDLFINSNSTPRVHKNTEIYIDILALSKNDAKKQKSANDLEAVKDTVKPIAECVLNLEPGGATVKEGKNEGVVSGLGGNKTTLTITRIGNRGAKSPLDAYCYDLCFAMEPGNDLYKKIFSKDQNGSYLFAWAWTVNDTTKKEYDDSFGVDIVSQDKRIEFLKQGEQSCVGFAIDYYLDLMSMNTKMPRRVNGAAAFVDNFPFDEPSYNFLKVENALPFKMFGAGAQIGPVGLCKKDVEYHKEFICKKVMTRDFIIKDGEKLQDSCKPQLYLDEESSEHGNGASRYGHGLKSDLDEYHSAGDYCFLFKNYSASLWINSIEKDDQKSDNATITSDNNSFMNNKLEIVFHDYTIDYHDKCKDLQLISFEIIFEQKTFDLKKFVSINIAGNEDIKDKNGKLLAKIGKGIPGYGFTGCCHNDIKIRGQKNSSQKWESHSLAHRPLVFVYELERDLNADEIDRLKNVPCKCTLFFGADVARRHGAEYTIPFDTVNGTKKGYHAILVYIVSNEQQLEVIMPDDTIIPALDRVAGYGDVAEYRGFTWPMQTFSKVDIFESDTDGLFQKNPVIIVDDFSWANVAGNKNRDARNAYEKAMVKDGVSFLLGFIPKIGDLATAAWEVGVDVADGKPVDNKTKIDIANKGISFFLECLNKDDSEASEADKERIIQHNEGIKKISTSSGTVLNAMSTIASLQKFEKMYNDYYDSVSKNSSPFLRGVSFGEGDRDSLYLMAVTKNSLTFNKDAISYKVDKKPDTVSLFMNRELTDDSHQPFNFQFGPNAGLLMRNDSNSADSVGYWRRPFMESLAGLQDALNSKDKIPAGDYFKKLISGKSGKDLKTIFTEVKVNKALSDSIESKKIIDVLEKKIKGIALSLDDAVKLSTILNLMKYIDAVFATCPSCGHTVSFSWGWCPYHATREHFPLEDNNGNGKLKDEFLLIDETKQTIQKILNSPLIDAAGNNSRLLVHWTEFIIG